MAEERRDEGGGQRQGRDGRPDEGRRRFQGRHRGFRGKPGGQQQQGRAPENQPQREARGPQGGQPRPEEQRELLTCPLCDKPLYDLSTALSSNKETGEPAHFDCVLERVMAAETLAAGEKIVYLGSGAFGVVEYKDRAETAFTVKRRIQWEKEGEKRDWRKALSARIANL